MKLLAATLLLCVTTLLASAAGHFSIYTTNELSFKRPLDKESGLRLVSIGAEGLVTIKCSDGTALTARLDKSKTFRDQHGRTRSTAIELLSVSDAKDRVVIRTEMRVYPAK